ncbi:MAG: glucose-1-phosphate thymidylyltransferase [Candidatus Eiseniibacteriota bacterium]|nr:MAG: glucose-1-phosphate thymidylyltransferase [Candidatus Eisenbacteria bacterium]
MKGLILSGGKGTRLRPITFTSAKQLVPVANRPILFYGIEAIRDAGITDVGIVVGDTKDEISAAVGDGKAFGIRVTYIEQELPLGLAHAVKVSRDFIGRDPFVMFLGDNLIKQGITALVEEFRKEGPNSMILLAEVDNPSDFGVAELKEGKVIRLEEKPKKPASNYALVGVYMFDSSIFEAVENIKPSWRDELEITDAIQYLIDRRLDVRSHIISGWWKDTGKLEDLLEANRMILLDLDRDIQGKVNPDCRVEGNVVIGKGTEVLSSLLRGPLIVGENCRVEHSYVGPFTSVHDNVEIRDSEIEHSIVLSGSKITCIGPRIESSLIGRDTVIRRCSRKPRCFRFMVGDSSGIEVL